MKKKTKTSKLVKKTAAKKPAAKKAVKKAKKVAKKVAKKAVKKAAPKKAAPKKSAPKKAAKKVASKKPVAKKPAAKKAAKKSAKKAVKKAAPKKAVKKTATKTATKKPVQKAVPKKTAPKAASKSFTSKMQKAVVTTVLPPKLTNARIASSALPSQAAVKAPKAPQAKLAATPLAANTRKRLNKDELKFFENLLNDKKETLLQEQSYLEDNALRLNSKEGAGDLSSHAYHLADHATETQDREQAFHLASREGKFLYYIEEALDRVRAGTFGICKRCGVLIPKARLEAVPTAKMCINCKSMQEHAVVEDAA